MTKAKQFIFDSRYGWVYDEWRDPVAVAHIGGRGMFAIVPLGRATFGKTIDLMNKGADLAAEILQRRPYLQLLQSELHISIVKGQKRFTNSFNEAYLQPSIANLSSFLKTLARRKNGDHQSTAYEFEFVESNKPIVMPELHPGSVASVPSKTC